MPEESKKESFWVMLRFQIHATRTYVPTYVRTESNETASEHGKHQAK